MASESEPIAPSGTSETSYGTSDDIEAPTSEVSPNPSSLSSVDVDTESGEVSPPGSASRIERTWWHTWKEFFSSVRDLNLDPTKPEFSTDEHRAAQEAASAELAARVSLPFFGTNPAHLDYLGPSVILYFRYLQLMMVFFAVLCVPAGFAAAFHASAGAAPEGQNFVFQMTLGNTLLHENTVAGIDIDATFKWIDFGLVVGMLFLVIRLPSGRPQKSSPRLRTAGSYSVQFSNLPASFSGRQFQLYLTQHWGRLCHLAVVLRDGAVITDPLIPSSEHHQDGEGSDDGVSMGVPSLSEEKGIVYSRPFVAIATFEFEWQAARCLFAFQRRLRCLGNMCCCSCFQVPDFDGHRLSAKRPGEPSDVLWENIGYSWLQTRGRRLMTLVVLLALVAVDWVVLTRVTDYHFDGQTGQNQISMTEAVALGLAIVVFNGIIKMSLVATTRFEKHSSVSNLELAISRKKILIDLLNNLGVTLFIFGLPRATGPGRTFPEEWYMSAGSVATSALFMDIVATIIIQGLHPWTWVRNCVRRRQAKTVHELSHAYMGPEFRMWKHFTGLLMPNVVSFAYVSGMPALMGLGLIKLVVVYCIQKYNVLRRNRRPPHMDNQVPSFVRTAMLWGLLVHITLSVLVFRGPESDEGWKWSELSWFPSLLGAGLVVLCMVVWYMLMAHRAGMRLMCGTSRQVVTNRVPYYAVRGIESFADAERYMAEREGYTRTGVRYSPSSEFLAQDDYSVPLTAAAQGSVQ